MGNIKTVSENGVLKHTYTYDTLGQLTCDQVGTKSIYYNYDSAGNITSKVFCENGIDVDRISYSYGDATWRDLLTKVGNTTINYDAIGNPLNWTKSSTLTWTGRQLTSYQTSSSNVYFTYNSDGIRTKKTVQQSGGQVSYSSEFILDGNKIVKEIRTYSTNTTSNIYYYYDKDGSPIGFNYNNTNYSFGKNSQGDIVKVFNTSGVEVASYTYDAWGNVSTPENNSIADINPFLYRGYYYDTETGLYYVSSRYYDPETCRFINADNQLSTGSDLTGMNLFAYCGNNPIMRVDPTGHAWWHWAIAAAVVVVAAAAVVVTAGGAAPALLAVASVANGVAAATTASTVAAGVFIGSATAFGGAALVAASNSKSVSDFNEQGNWGTVAGTVGGGLIGGVDGYSMAKSQNSSPSKSVPNPNGKKGGAAHQAEIAKQTAKFDPSQVRYEVKINTPGGAKPYRYADFSVTQNGQTWYGNVGRGLQSGLPCARERAAISDIQGAGGTIYFFPYN